MSDLECDSKPTGESHYEALLERHGLGPLPNCEGPVLGSMMLAGGDALMNVAHWLGHTRVSTTERWYAHQIEAMQDEASERMRRRLDKRRAQRPTPEAQPEVHGNRGGNENGG